MDNIYYTDAHTIDIDGTPYPWPPTPAPRRARRRNWQSAIGAYLAVLMVIGGALLLGGAPPIAPIILAAVCSLELIIYLLAAWRWNRL